MRVAIIDYGSGNLRSATKAFERAAREAGIDAEIDLTADADRVRTRRPHRAAGRRRLCRLPPPACDAVDGHVARRSRKSSIAKGRPFLGICVGMQLMSARGLEKTVTKGFGWIAGDVKEMTPADPALKIPQIGWNTLDAASASTRCSTASRPGADGLHAYFVHSYHLAAQQPGRRARHDRLWRRR